MPVDVVLGTLAAGMTTEAVAEEYALRGIGADVSEVKIEGNQGSPLIQDDIGQTGVGRAAQMLCTDRHRIVPGLAEDARHVGGQVLIDFEGERPVRH